MTKEREEATNRAMSQREQAIATIREALDSCIVAKDRGMAWQYFDGSKVEAAKSALSALSEPGGEAPVEAKALTDEEIERIAASRIDTTNLRPTAREAYHAKLCLRYARDNGYLSPSPLSADRIMEVVGGFMDDESAKLGTQNGSGIEYGPSHIRWAEMMSDLRSRLSSELGLR